MNVAIINNNYGRIGGGTGAHCRDLVKYLSRNGINVTLFSPDVDNGRIRGNSNTVELGNLKNGSLRRRMCYVFFSLKNYHINQRKIDVIHFHCPDYFPGIYLFSKLYKVPTVFTFQSGLFVTKQQNLLLHKHVRSRLKGCKRRLHRQMIKVLYRISLKRSNFIIAKSEEQMEWAKSLGANKQNLRLIPNPVDLEIFRPNDSNVLNSKKEKIILYVGGLRPIKNLRCLLKAILLVHQKINNTKLVLVGEGEEKQNLIQFAKDLGISKYVSFIGSKHREILCDYYSSADVLVLPSFHDCSPSVIFEAFASGLPAIGSNVGGIPTLINDGYNGFLFSNGDEHALAQRIVKILKDDVLRNKFSQNAFRTTQENSWEKKLPEFIKIYESVLGRRLK